MIVQAQPKSKVRIDWVDYAKGICIIFVVMMHSTLGVSGDAGQEGWLNYVVTWAQPFRMPDFFLVAGLFLAMVIDRDWRSYLDKKLLHFVYFYILWTAIQFAVKIPINLADHSAAEIFQLYLQTFVQPFSTLWFIYMLPIMFIITKALRNVSWMLVLGAAALLEIAPIHTGYMLVDEFAARYVYFFAGYIFAGQIFKAADWIQDNRLVSTVGLIVWAVVNALIVFSGYSSLPLMGLTLGALGAFAIIAASSLVSTIHWAGFLRYCGENSIVIYLAFFFPMAVTRIVLLKLGIIEDIGTISAIVTAVAVISPLILHWMINKVGFGKFLFERPAWATLSPPSRKTQTVLVPAEN